jgi:DZF domain
VEEYDRMTNHFRWCWKQDFWPNQKTNGNHWRGGQKKLKFYKTLFSLLWSDFNTWNLHTTVEYETFHYLNSQQTTWSNILWTNAKIFSLSQSINQSNMNMKLIMVADANTETVSNTEDLLPKEPCLQALAALRHSKWFQVCFCFFLNFGLF